MVCVYVGVLRVYTAEEGAEGPHLSPSSSGLFAPLLPRPGTRGSPGQAGIAASPAGLGSSAKPPRLSASSPEAAAGTLGRVSTFLHITFTSLFAPWRWTAFPSSLLCNHRCYKTLHGRFTWSGVHASDWGEILV